MRIYTPHILDSAKTKPSVTTMLVMIAVLLGGFASAYQAPVLIRPVESTPIQLGDLEFSVVTQDEWCAFRYWGSKFNATPDGQDEIPLQLRIVNRGDKSIIVPTFDRFQAMLKGSDGKEIPLGGIRDYTLGTASILLKPGQGYSYRMIARLVEPHDGDGIELIYKDRTGGGSVTPMKPGTYSLYYQLRAPGPFKTVASGATGAVTFEVTSAPKS